MEKFVAGVPGWELGKVGGVQVDEEAEAAVEFHAGEVPIVAIFVRGLMVAGFREFVG
jgi:thioredoxin-like negative regulator of GroEL